MGAAQKEVIGTPTTPLHKLLLRGRLAFQRRTKRPAAAAGERAAPVGGAAKAKPKVKMSSIKRRTRFLQSVEASEAAAKAAVETGDASLDAVQGALQLLEVPRNTSRKNVMPKGQRFINGMLLGVFAYGGRVGLSLATSRHPWLTRLLAAAMRMEAPEFPFTSIQVNYNYAAKPHVDRNNLGPSYIVALGEHAGGDLWVHEEGGQATFTMPEDDEDVSAVYRAGKSFPGRELCVRGRWARFDGTRLHFTLPFSGERYSLIFFACDRCAAADASTQEGLLQAGFEFDWSSPALQEQLAKKQQRVRAASLEEQQKRQLREVAREAREERVREQQEAKELRGRCIGRTWAGGWGLRCTSGGAESSDFCGTHAQGDKWKVHGRMDGPLPPAKQEEMAKCQRKMVAQGKRPPADVEATLLVELAAA